MADRRRSVRIQQPMSPYNSLISSAQMISSPTGQRLIIQNKEWQREGWDFYDAMGEFYYGVTWLGNALSRVRLRAAIMSPGSEEPELLTDGPAADSVSQLAGGVGGQAAMMKSLGIKLSVPGEGFVVAEETPLGQIWSVKSADEIRPRQNVKESRTLNSLESRESKFEIQVDEGAWRPLSHNSLVCRVWQPSERYTWRATSATLPALPILRELDLYNRRIITDLVSRLASNGILIMPEEVTFPVRPEFKDEIDPFVAEMIDVASKSIQNPGSASAAIPIPLRVPAQWVDKFQHITFASLFDDKILDARDRTIKRLATTLNIPQEVLMGVGEVNHWTAWQIDESGIKIHIAPMAEIICHGLTLGFLQPRLEAMGVSPPKDGRYVVWYDTTELSSKPDLAENADQAYDRMEISAAAYRREKGFSDDDAPDPKELKDMALKTFIAKNFNVQALKELTGLDLTPPPPPGMDPNAPGAPNVPGQPKPPAAGGDSLPPTGPPAAGPNPPSNGRVPAGA